MGPARSRPDLAGAAAGQAPRSARAMPGTRLASGALLPPAFVRFRQPAGRRPAGREPDDLMPDLLAAGAEAGQHLGGHAAALAEQAEQHVLGADGPAAMVECLLLRELEDLLGARGERDVP